MSIEIKIADRRIKCAICKGWLNVGDQFLWEQFKFHGITRSLPIHPEHSDAYRTATKQLEEAKLKAAEQGPEGVDIVSDSILDELKAEIARGKKWGYTFVTHDRLESLIRKYSIQTPGDISDQPGNWQIRGGRVEAIQYQADIESVAQVIEWVRSQGGTIEIQDDEVTPYLKLDSPRQPNIVNPTWWVVKTADGMFYTMPDSDFHTIYVPKEESHV